MGPVLTIAFGIALGLLFFVLFIWIILLLAYLLFGDGLLPASMRAR